MNAGPLQGIRVVELGGIGPGPFAAMLMADLGAEVVRIDRPPREPLGEHQQHERDLLLRGRRSIALDLKSADGVEVALRLTDRADVLLDPFRPGVAERLGIGPETATSRNPGLVYARMTGWGQTGPLASVAGHDLNYVALAGPLAAMGRRGSPPAPALNLIGDFGGGGMLLAFGVTAALVERNRSGRGQVIDVAMTDGVAALSASIVGFTNMGVWRPERESNFLDGGAPYYDSYETSDGRHVTIGSIEPQFYALLLDKLGLDAAEWPQDDRRRWPELHARLAEIFRGRTRDEWCELLEGTDVCFAPVLGFDEAPKHPHLAARGTYVEEHGMLQPAPVPRFSRTPGAIQTPPCSPGQHTREVLADWGFTSEEQAAAIASGVAVVSTTAG
ncbi:CaiB/BaiF CoA transferase family protein [Pseudonocardia benzenivorans]|uniref:Alpha-methylacyl-CoA racemase n=2 Tax=Pseudonocardia TaxID=1847 RepID=F4CXQ5_PSEUX|nr:CaiB/BaiF CoA-transferase family protein [Pseudonocardia dioxanivorans]AEA27638.1 Alpha-methylacyl-CoA racemase [Pseudonocardia dioxanivorans CB1190]